MPRKTSSAVEIAPQAGQRPGARLPALSPGDAEKIREETEAAVADLMAHALSANTQRSYRSALRYWDAWHWAAYGRGLPLFAEPRQSVPGTTVRAFVAHHTAQKACDGRVLLAMPTLVRTRMEAIGAFGRRLVGERAGKNSGVDAAIPAVATVLQRVALLNGAHKVANEAALQAAKEAAEIADAAVIPPTVLVAPVDADPGLSRVLRTFKKAAAANAEATLRRPKKSITAQEMDLLLQDCEHDDLIGRRDAALLRVGYTGRRRGELASMKMEHLQAFPLAVPVGDITDGWMWGVRKSKGRTATTADGVVDEVPIVGYAAQVLETWLDSLRHLTGLETGPVWPRLSIDSAGDIQVGPPMDEEDIAAVVKKRMQDLGFNPKEYAGHSLRSGAARTAASVGDARAMLNHKSESTTRQFYADQQAQKIEAAVRHDIRLRKK